MITWRSFHQRPVYLAVGLVLIILLWDFFTRVWFPLETELAADTQRGGYAEYQRVQFTAMPTYLAEWIDQAAREAAEQQQAAADETEQEAALRREEERQRKLQPLEGSTQLADIRLRVRAVFKHQTEDGQARSLALAEQQDVATGDVSRVILRPGEERGGYVITSITANAVALQHPTQQDIRLYVFEFK